MFNDAFTIFIFQIIYLPIATVKTMLLVKGKKLQASFITIFEAIIYIISLGKVFSDLSNLWNIVAYVAGTTLGIYLGGKLEEKLALGFRCVQINLTKKNNELIHCLRESRFGITTFKGEGINEEERYRVEAVCHRNREIELIKLIKSYEENAFIVSYEPTQFDGGYLIKQSRTGYLNKAFNLIR